MLRVHQIDAFYGRIQVLWDVSFMIREKEIVALVGANGAGKSTILDVISGLLRPNSGAVEFLGIPLKNMTPREIIDLGISYIPEGRCLFSEMSVRENLELGAYANRTWKKRTERLERIYQMFPILKSREKQLAKTLSGGEQQMLTIGRGVMVEPKLCMIDEVSYGLSPIMMKSILNKMRELRDQGMTILLIEQNVKAALQVCDRAYVLENGRITLQGESEEVLKNSHVKVAYLGL